METQILRQFTPTEELIQIFAVARQEAINFNSPMVTPRHLLLAIAIYGGAVVDLLANTLSLSREGLIEELRKDMNIMDSLRKTRNPTLSPAANDYVIWAAEQAKSLDHRKLHAGHLLMSFCSDSGSYLCKLLKARIGRAGGFYEAIHKWLQKNPENLA